MYSFISVVYLFIRLIFDECNSYIVVCLKCFVRNYSIAGKAASDSEDIPLSYLTFINVAVLCLMFIVKLSSNNSCCTFSRDLIIGENLQKY